MKIDILCVGKIKESYLREGVLEYKKRLSRYCDLNILEMADEKTPENASDRERELILEKEGDRLWGHVAESAYVIALVIEGKQLSSTELSKKLDEIQVMGKSHIQFVIGGSLGLTDKIQKRADLKLSFSKMTFPHQLMRMILLEQIYRSFRISRNEPYHK
ncbi:MAG: 23S rRNA (pseudouridine(1915)-N(3))-methyltransferase RlmH [Lachnospiraceae bacterium]|nr:23S rRNA (pseudouridine(1915)-N(3))-methyltransferase RlmH [Lachnospiraceae bacterium]